MMDDSSHERDAIRDEISDTEMNVLTYHGGEPSVALVNRTASTEYSTEGETIVLVEWAGEDWALSVAEGRPTGWELVDELVSFHDSRSDAIQAAKRLFAAREASTGPDLEALANCIAKTTAARGVDVYAVEHHGLSAAEWATMTGRDRSTVSRNVRRANDSDAAE